MNRDLARGISVLTAAGVVALVRRCFVPLLTRTTGTWIGTPKP